MAKPNWGEVWIPSDPPHHPITHEKLADWFRFNSELWAKEIADTSIAASLIAEDGGTFVVYPSFRHWDGIPTPETQKPLTDLLDEELEWFWPHDAADPCDLGEYLSALDKLEAHIADIRYRIARRADPASADERPQDQDPKGLEAKPASAVGAAETPKTPLSHAEAKQPALSTGPTPPTPLGVGPTSIEGASK